MVYGFRPENWPAFEAELQKRAIAVAEIERVEIRPGSTPDPAGAGHAGTVSVVVTLRSGRVDSWSHPRQPRSGGRLPGDA
jgi:hypothetical protein